MEAERRRGRKRLKMTEMLRDKRYNIWDMKRYEIYIRYEKIWDTYKIWKDKRYKGIKDQIWDWSQHQYMALTNRYNSHTTVIRRHMFVSPPVYVYTLINDGKYLIQTMSTFTNNNPEEIFLHSSVFPLTSKLTRLQQTNMFIMNPYITVQFKRLFM